MPCSSAGARRRRWSPPRASETCSIGRQTRADLYRLCADHPPPLVPLERRDGVRERSGPDGVLVPLDLATLPGLDAEAVAVCLLFGYRTPRTSGRRRRARAALPGVHVVASHEVAPAFREYERTATTASALPRAAAGRYLRALGERSPRPGCPRRS